jgi:GPI ethanolamine phosphate transferase membrane region
MSNTASNYNMPRLNAGMVVATIAVIAASFVLFSSPSTGLAGAAFLAITVLYGLMMFASSFVEEEQHFWYWSASGWFAYLYFIKYVCISRTIRSDPLLSGRQESDLRVSESFRATVYWISYCVESSKAVEPDRPEICRRT